jgi:hypothetical protein
MPGCRTHASLRASTNHSCHFGLHPPQHCPRLLLLSLGRLSEVDYKKRHQGLANREVHLKSRSCCPTLFPAREVGSKGVLRRLLTRRRAHVPRFIYPLFFLSFPFGVARWPSLVAFTPWRCSAPPTPLRFTMAHIEHHGEATQATC